MARKAAAAGAQRESGPNGGGRGRSAWTAGDLEARRTAGVAEGEGARRRRPSALAESTAAAQKQE